MKNETIIKELEGYNPTPFQKRVLIATMKIPKGQTRTYKQIAIQIKRKNAYRAVGSALKWNPIPIKIPCHRVIKSDGSPGNYNSGGTKRKMELLKSERAI